MNEKINKLVDYCKEHHITEEEGIRIIHAFLNRKGYTKTKWKKVKFSLYADARIQHNGGATIDLVTEIVQTSIYQKSFEEFYPWRKLDKIKEAVNLTKLIADPRQYLFLQRVFKEKGYSFSPQRTGFIPKHLQETRKITHSTIFYENKPS